MQDNSPQQQRRAGGGIGGEQQQEEQEGTELVRPEVQGTVEALDWALAEEQQPRVSGCGCW